MTYRVWARSGANSPGILGTGPGTFGRARFKGYRTKRTVTSPAQCEMSGSFDQGGSFATELRCRERCGRFAETSRRGAPKHFCIGWAAGQPLLAACTVQYDSITKGALRTVWQPGQRTRGDANLLPGSGSRTGKPAGVGGAANSVSGLPDLGLGSWREGPGIRAGRVSEVDGVNQKVSLLRGLARPPR